ncbi:hypothetical protein [Paraliomyxa miuraensis]|uniref:hypothetical protein n=1 Tax=Paraliomyxa miuraensis TaxID=376150 RepID=UPI0022570A06|nr:hypothetical protein [Paraliomyxa miuraensis]
MNRYKYSKQKGALQEASPAVRGSASVPEDEDSYVAAHDSSVFSLSELAALAGEAPVRAQANRSGQAQALRRPLRRAGDESLSTASPTRYYGRASMFRYTIEEGQKMLVEHSDGTMTVAEGPCRIWRWGKRFSAMEHHIAHPGEFLIVRYRDGRQEHVRGPTDLWLDGRKHASVSKEELFQIAEREAIVVYGKKADGTVERRIVMGPEDFMPEPGEWVHTFSWHGSKPGPDGILHKMPNGLVFQKLWLLPDQMYHDIPEVRTADGAVLTIRLMLFFELHDIERMLITTHDPIGDFVNAATSDVVEFLSKHDYDSFRDNIDKLNLIDTYKQLTRRAEQCGYRIGNIVYRGYGAPQALQQMHEQSLESKTRLSLQRETEKQAQDLEDFKLERNLARSVKARQDRTASQSQELDLARREQQAERERVRAERELMRGQKEEDAAFELELEQKRQDARLAMFRTLAELGVDLTQYLTQSRSDQIIELRGSGQDAHLHLGPTPDPPRGRDGTASLRQSAADPDR